MGRYYVALRVRQSINLKYLKQEIADGKAKCFDNYEDAYKYYGKAWSDDCDCDIFYKTEDDKFLRVHLLSSDLDINRDSDFERNLHNAMQR